MKQEKDIPFEELKEYSDEMIKNNVELVEKMLREAGFSQRPSSDLVYGVPITDDFKDRPNAEMLNTLRMLNSSFVEAWQLAIDSMKEQRKKFLQANKLIVRMDFPPEDAQIVK
jgi:hypothetical protein